MKVREQCFSSLDTFFGRWNQSMAKIAALNTCRLFQRGPTSCDVSLPVMCNKILQSQNIWSARMQEWRKKSAQTHLPYQHAICKDYMKWSTCTCVDRNRLLLTDHTSKLMFVSFYSLNVKRYFQSVAYDVWKSNLKAFSLYYLRKSVQSVKIWRELWSNYHATRPPSCNLLMMPFEFELYGTSQVFRFPIS